MKVLKKIVISLLVASALGAVPTLAMAEADKGRITYAPAEAIDIVANHVQAAIDAQIVGNSDEAATHIKAALDMSKEINANDKVDSARSKANNKLKEAAKAIKEGGNGAETALRDALDRFKGLKSLI